MPQAVASKSKITILAALWLLLTIACFGQGFTHIVDTLNDASGNPYSGSLQINWRDSNKTEHSMEVQIASGVLDIKLAPSVPGQPYTVTGQVGTNAFVDTWYVPSTASTLDLTKIRGKAASGGATTCAGLSDAAASCSTDATNASNISTGTLPNSRLSAIPNSALATPGLSISGPYLTDGTNYYSGPHNAPMTRPACGSFSWLATQGTATEDCSSGAAVMTDALAGSDHVRARGLNIGSNSTLSVEFVCNSKLIDFNSCHVGFRESSTGKLETLTFSVGTTRPGQIQVSRFTSASAFDSFVFTEGITTGATTWTAVRLIYVAGSPGTLTYQTSKDDITWRTVYTEAANSWFSSTGHPDQWFYAVDAANSTAGGDITMTMYSFKPQ